ncbi:membrane protein [Actinoplanes sp. SE50]|uniref:hypothetical protein n=1 Tax=unclassified Actinoplanes TaxID=2626549 RepID=UPI00023ED5A0|nr:MULTISPECIES: hypothetical protein [unclassified Actinoplanes]AEV82846.1 hypothetical protein ACPL_1949 [Actinoplanes sp. SE50/110]ATO81242.1 membrane protein [Actinoplanes sp. SE50]SLL98649.1 membrane protein [Actinoplanes sp. SE50/110]
MDPKMWMYLGYLVVSVALTIWVGTTLARNGMVFLTDVFADDRLARAVNQLLVMGFYLLNLGYLAIAMRTGDRIGNAAEALEKLSGKIGWVLLVLGALHLSNVFFLGRYRRGRLRPAAPTPGRTPFPAYPPGVMPGLVVPPVGPVAYPYAAGHPAAYPPPPYAAAPARSPAPQQSTVGSAAPAAEGTPA